MAKWDVDSNVMIKAKVVELISNDSGVFYKVKFPANNKSTIVFLEEDELVDGNSTPDPEPQPDPEPTPDPDPDQP